MLDFAHVSSLRRHILTILGCAGAVLPVNATLAQTTASNGNGGREPPEALQEIIVTAQKRSESLMDVPISVTAVTGDQLARMGITSPDQLQAVVPSLTQKPSRFGVPVYNLRGIGFDDWSVGSSPAVSVSVDQVPLPFLIMTPAASLDIERVEVLKGPQGTLFGQNTTGGAINFIAAKPTSTLQIGTGLTYGRFNEIDADGYISGPITDTVGIRVAVRHENRDAWQVSETRPDDELGHRNFSEGRLLLDWKPDDELSIELNVNGWIDKSQTQAAQFVIYSPTIPPGKPSITAEIGGLPPTPDEARRADWATGLNHNRNNSQYQVSARADWAANEHVTITSISSYAKLKSNVPTDTSGTNFDLFYNDQIGSIETVSDELRAAVDLTHAKITVGGNYEHDHTSDAQRINYDGSNNQIGPYEWHAFTEAAEQRVDTYAGFLSADIPLLSTLTGQLGVRYTKQDRDFDGCLYDGGDSNLADAIALVPTLAGLPFNPAPPGRCVTLDSTLQRLPVVSEQLNQNNVSWRTGLSWKPDDNVLTYASVTRGFKAGGFSPVPAVFAGQFKPVTQEQVTAYEIGAKATLLERRLELAGAVFYDNYLNKQLLGSEIFPPFGSLPTLQNVPKSVAKGAELDISALPVRGLNLTAGVSYVQTRVSDSFITSDQVGAVWDIKGESFPNTPRWQGHGAAYYEAPISSTLSGFFGGDMTIRSSTRTDFGNNPYFLIRPYTLLGLRAGIGTLDGRWRLELWGANVTDRFYATNVFKAGEMVTRTAGMPATYGVTLRARF